MKKERPGKDLRINALPIQTSTDANLFHIWVWEFYVMKYLVANACLFDNPYHF
jgi:hypothetical protein